MPGVVDTFDNLKQKISQQTRSNEYFSAAKKGEMVELKAELTSEKRDRRKEAVKKDCEDNNPLIRALAIRTMGCIHVEKIAVHLCEPLRRCLKDQDPYVRKTAAVCVAKLHDINSQLVEDNGFLELIRDLLCDSNPMVVANAVAAISEMLESNTSPTALQILEFDESVINKLLTALDECTEWGQVFILDAVANYVPPSEVKAQGIAERITPRLAHANAAVVLSSVKVIMKMLDIIDPSSDFAKSTNRKLAPPLVTLLSTTPEIQYVALRNINLIIQKRKDILKDEVRIFFVKYNDPIYVKLEKLDIMIRLIDQSNCHTVLNELKEYAKEVDVDFVRKSVRAIGRCAVKIETAAQQCVSHLLDLIQTKVNYVVQEAVVVIKDIFRKYPNKYESVIATLCEHLGTLDEPEARASMIWIIGEYAERIDNADELLESFLESFQDENSQVQLQLLTAIVKLFLKRPADTQELVQTVLTLATQESDNPDLRDRGYIYWRLLSTDPTAAKEVVLAQKPVISEETDALDATLLDELISHLSTLASVYHKPPSSFVEGRYLANQHRRPTSSSHSATGQQQSPTVIPAQETLIGDLLDLSMDDQPALSDQQYRNQSIGDTALVPDLLGDLSDTLLPSSMGGGGPSNQPPSSTADVLADVFGSLGDGGQFGTSTASNPLPPTSVWLTPAHAKGLEVKGRLVRSNQLAIELQLANHAMAVLNNFDICFNKNSFSLAVESGLLGQKVASLLPGQSTTVQLPINHSADRFQQQNPLMLLQVAIKNNVEAFYFNTSIPIYVLFTEGGQLEKKLFLSTWKELPDENEKQFTLKVPGLGPDVCSRKLQQYNIFNVTTRNVDGRDMLYLSIRLTNDIRVLAELQLQQPDAGSARLSLRSRSVEVLALVSAAFEEILQS